MSANVKYLLTIIIAIGFNFRFAIFIEHLYPQAIGIEMMNEKNIYSQSIQLKNTKVYWKYNNDYSNIHFILSSPEKGWIAIGLNDQDDILGADLFMIAKGDVTDKIKCEHHYVTNFGVYPKVESLNKMNRLLEYNYNFDQQTKGFNAEIIINAKTGEDSDIRFRHGKKLYLIFAYSTQSDFAHHSIYREHFLVELYL
jgi:hypothetical protein